MTSSDRAAWHLITCEYPPTPGGVADYTFVMASSLAARGLETHVWCPVAASPAHTPGVTVHASFADFGMGSLRRVGRQLDAQPSPRRLFVQWVPHGYGFRSMNLPFAVWLAWRALMHGDLLNVMVHEPFVDLAIDRMLPIALMQRLMLVCVCAFASRVWISIPRWIPTIRPYVRAAVPIECLPIPAPPVGAPSAADAAEVRTRFAPGGQSLVGHLGTYSPMVTPLLAVALGVVLEQSSARALLIGPGSERFRTQFLARRPDLADRVTATGMVPPNRLSSYLQACDVMVQPYPDGISTRRTSSLALLATSLPVVSNEGRLSESFWRETGAVALATEPDGVRIGDTVLRLLDDPRVRASYATRGHDLYEQRFDVRHAVEPLLATA